MSSGGHRRGFGGLSDTKQFTQWYALYVRGYAKLADPLMESLKGLDVTKKQRKGIKEMRKKQMASGPEMTPRAAAAAKKEIFWTEEMKRCFEGFKIRFRDGAVLHQPDISQPFYLRCDSSTYAVWGGSLSRWVPLAICTQWHFFLASCRVRRVMDSIAGPLERRKRMRLSLRCLNFAVGCVIRPSRCRCALIMIRCSSGTLSTWTH